MSRVLPVRPGPPSLGYTETDISTPHGLSTRDSIDWWRLKVRRATRCAQNLLVSQQQRPLEKTNIRLPQIPWCLVVCCVNKCLPQYFIPGPELWNTVFFFMCLRLFFLCVSANTVHDRNLWTVTWNCTIRTILLYASIVVVLSMDTKQFPEILWSSPEEGRKGRTRKNNGSHIPPERLYGKFSYCW